MCIYPPNHPPVIDERLNSVKSISSSQSSNLYHFASHSWFHDCWLYHPIPVGLRPNKWNPYGLNWLHHAKSNTVQGQNHLKSLPRCNPWPAIVWNNSEKWRVLREEKWPTPKPCYYEPIFIHEYTVYIDTYIISYIYHICIMTFTHQKIKWYINIYYIILSYICIHINTQYMYNHHQHN